MEYVPGCDLEEFLRARRPSLASVVTVASDVAAALSVARQSHLVHGDVKAANVLITEAGRAKLTDFGISRRGPGGLAGAGSPSAMSPEQYLGEALDTRADLFALGCLLYRMLAGDAPFHRDGKLDEKWLLERPPMSLHERVAPDEEVPAELLTLVTQLLARQPGERPATMRPVRSVLREVKRGMPLSQRHNLLAEARPFFRRESPEEIPPPIPPDLGRGSRSHLARGGVWSWLFARGWRRPVLGSLVVLAVGIPAGVIALQKRETMVYIEAPAMNLAKSADLPPLVSSHWLVEQVKMSLHRQLGAIRVDGPIGATPVNVYYAGGNRPAVRHAERIELFLHCRDELCALAVSREHDRQRRIQHAALLPGMSEGQRAAAVRSATDRLYD
jgi:hypothetical protein